MMSYTAFGRQAEDWEAHIMPRPVFDLGVELWRVALPFLTAESRAHPPTACQLLLYYVLFNVLQGRACFYQLGTFDTIGTITMAAGVAT